MTARPKAYSYIRFSSAKQAEGDSLRRQTAMAREYAERNGLELADLTLRDLGKSAFRGKNAVEGALGEFIRAVDSGKVESGSYLIVESLDRLSRDRIMSALNQFADLLGKGVRIVTLQDGQEYNESSLDNLQGLIVPLAIMSRANEESETKSKRGRAAWEQKKKRARETGEVTTSSVPAWFRVKIGAQGRRIVELDARKAKVVRRIFEMARDGWGTERIAVEFNVSGVPVFGRGNGWTHSYIRSILKNATVIGQFQPMKNIHENGKAARVPDGDPVEGYFPAALKGPEGEALFYGVKHSKRGPSGAKDGLPKNLLSKLVFCGKCGAPCHYINKGKNNVYLVCDNHRRFQSCDALPVRYFDTFTDVTAYLRDFRPFEADQNAANERERKIDALSGQISETQEIIEGLAEKIMRTESAALERKLVEQEEKLSALNVLRNIRKEQATTATTRAKPLDYMPLRDYVLFRTRRRTGVDIETARRGLAHIAAEIRRIVERIEVIQGQPIKVIPRD